MMPMSTISAILNDLIEISLMSSKVHCASILSGAHNRAIQGIPILEYLHHDLTISVLLTQLNA